MGARNLIVLGGGEDQVPAYREGRRLGFRVIGVDQRPDALGAAEADEFLCMTSRDPDGIARALGDIEVAAVISPASDAAQESVARLNRIYGTAYRPAPDALRGSVDKGFFRSLIDGLGLPTYRHAEGETFEELLGAAGAMTYPLIVKPVDSSGSKGVTAIEGPAQLENALDHAWKYSFRHRAIVEEVVSGRHCSAECFFSDGRPEFMAVTDRITTGPPTMISVAHVVPADLDPGTYARLEAQITRICAELGHVSGPVNFDFVLAPDGAVYFIEMGARLGGNGMPLMVRHAFGLNTVEAAIRLALGERPGLLATSDRIASLRILTATTDGVLHAVEGLEEVRRMPEVVEVQVFKSPGDRVNAYTQAAHKLGYLMVVADTRERLHLAIERALATLRFVVNSDVEGSP